MDDNRDKQHKTIKVWIRTRRNLRLLSAYTGKPMIALLDELVKAALVERQEKDK